MAGVRRKRALRRADELLQRVGLGDRGAPPAQALSGGPAAAGGRRPGPGGGPRDAPRRRAHRQPRLHPGRGDHLAAPRPASRRPAHHRVEPRRPPRARSPTGSCTSCPSSATTPARRGSWRSRPGRSIFEQGDRGELVYVIEAGRVEIVRQHADGTSEELAELGAGEYFGELGPAARVPPLGHRPRAHAGAAAWPTTCTTSASRSSAPPPAPAPAGRYSKSMTRSR